MRPISRILLTLAAILVFGVAAHATPVTVGSTQVRNWRYGDGAAYLYAYANSGFTPAGGGGYVMAGARGSGKWNQKVTCAASGGVLTVPSFSIESTTDSPDNNKAVYNFIFADSKGVEHEVYAANFFIPPVPASTSWDILRTQNAAVQGPRPAAFWTSTQTVEYFQQAVTVGGPATPTSNGRVRLHTAAPDPAAPEVVVTDDPRLPTQAENDALAGTKGSPSSSNKYVTDADTRLVALGVDASTWNSVCEAVAAIGSTRQVLDITTAMPSGSSCTVPSTLTLHPMKGGSVVLGSGHTIAIQSTAEEFRGSAVFSGSGTVSFSAVNSVKAVWWSGDFGQRLTAATAAVPSGGEVDARDLTDAQSLSATLTLNRAYVTYRFGRTALAQGANQIVLAPGTHGVHLIGDGSGAFNVRTAPATTFTYTGTGNNPAILVGDSSAQTDDFQMTGVHLVVTSSTGAGVRLVNARYAKITDNKIVGGANDTLMTTTAGIDLSGGAGTSTTYGGIGLIAFNEVGHFRFGIFVGGDADYSSNVYWIVFNNVHGYATTGGAAGGGLMTTGVYISGQDGIHVYNDVEGMGTGMYLGPNTSRVEGLIHCDTCGTYTLDADATSFGNKITVTWAGGGALHNLSIGNSVDDGSVKLGSTSTAAVVASASTLDLILQATGAGSYGIKITTGSQVLFGLPVKHALANIPIYANNAAAIAGGLTAGMFYRTGGDPDHLLIVH
jgi:hypothetical protein